MRSFTVRKFDNFEQADRADKAYGNEVDYVIVGAWARAMLSLRLFKENKRAAGRPKDLGDLDALPE